MIRQLGNNVLFHVVLLKRWKDTRFESVIVPDQRANVVAVVTNSRDTDARQDESQTYYGSAGNPQDIVDFSRRTLKNASRCTGQSRFEARHVLTTRQVAGQAGSQSIMQQSRLMLSSVNATHRRTAGDCDRSFIRWHIAQADWISIECCTDRHSHRVDR